MRRDSAGVCSDLTAHTSMLGQMVGMKPSSTSRWGWPIRVELQGIPVHRGGTLARRRGRQVDHVGAFASRRAVPSQPGLIIGWGRTSRGHTGTQCCRLTPRPIASTAPGGVLAIQAVVTLSPAVHHRAEQAPREPAPAPSRSLARRSSASSSRRRGLGLSAAPLLGRWRPALGTARAEGCGPFPGTPRARRRDSGRDGLPAGQVAHCVVGSVPAEATSLLTSRGARCGCSVSV